MADYEGRRLGSLLDITKIKASRTHLKMTVINRTHTRRFNIVLGLCPGINIPSVAPRNLRRFRRHSQPRFFIVVKYFLRAQHNNEYIIAIVVMPYY